MTLKLWDADPYTPCRWSDPRSIEEGWGIRDSWLQRHPWPFCVIRGCFSVTRGNPRSPIDVFAVTDLQDDDDELLARNTVEHTIRTNPDAKDVIVSRQAS